MKTVSQYMQHLQEIFQHITWKNILLTKFFVVGCAGLHMLISKSALIALISAAIAIYVSPAGLGSVQADTTTPRSTGEEIRYGLCGNGIVEYGERCDGNIACTLPCSCEEGFVNCDGSCIPATQACNIQNEQPPQETCPEDAERICATDLPGACKVGKQTCENGERSACSPLNTTLEACNEPNDAPHKENDTFTTQGQADNLDEVDKDCAGIDGGRHIIDKCGQCLHPSDSEFNECATQIETFTTQSTDTEQEEPTSNKVRISITAAQDRAYKACRGEDTIANCLDHLGVTLTDTSKLFFQRLRCELVNDPTDPDCNRDEFTTQSVTTPDSNSPTSLSKEQQKALFEACLEHETHAQDCARALQGSSFISH